MILLFDMRNYLCIAAIVAVMTKGCRDGVQLVTSRTEDLARGISLTVNSLRSPIATRARVKLTLSKRVRMTYFARIKNGTYTSLDISSCEFSVNLLKRIC